VRRMGAPLHPSGVPHSAQAHESTEVSKAIHACPHCGLIELSTQLLSAHILTAHSSEGAQLCAYPQPSSGMSKTLLARHTKRIHSLPLQLQEDVAFSVPPAQTTAATSACTTMWQRSRIWPLQRHAATLPRRT
jgi:hypothetical protein